jgi:predicted RNA-binding Zn ribbon-like protein
MTAVAPERAFTSIGGHVALDLLNTVRWRLDPDRCNDDLPTYAHVVAWAHGAGLLNERERTALDREAQALPARADEELATLRAVREHAYEALVHSDSRAVADLEPHHQDALTRARLIKTGTHWVWCEPEVALNTPRDRVTRAVVDLLTTPELATLHQCEDQACGWVYLDTSPRHNRRWCVASDCGNRNRARRFYTRHKAATPPIRD